MVTRTQRLIGSLALVALLGVPMAETVCAMLCTPGQAFAQSMPADDATRADAMSATHHHGGAAPAEGPRHDSTTPSAASVDAPGCDTHGRPDLELQATLTAGRIDTQYVSTLPVPTLGRAAFSLVTVRHGASDLSLPPGTSDPRIPLVLRI